MDDTPDVPERQPGAQGRRRGRASLVERAAGKMVTPPKPPAEPPASPLPEAEMLRPEDVPSDCVPLSQDGVDLAEALLEGTAREVSAPGKSEPKAAAAPTEAPTEAPRPESRGTRKARMVELDLPALEARQVITPGAKRNRTMEEFRLIKRMVLSRRWDENDLPGNAIVVTSALPSEGKTTTAINLAMSIAAEEDLRVLLIDADFIKPDALRQLGVSAGKGLIDVLQDPRMDISDVILRTNVDKLSLIPSGQLHERCTELLASARMDRLITELATRYEDRILIFDSPPLLATTESVVLASHMGQVVFVVQAGRTKRDSVSSALDLLGERQNLGIVLNRTRARFGSTQFGAYYGSYYYGYGEGKSK